MVEFTEEVTNTGAFAHGKAHTHQPAPFPLHLGVCPASGYVRGAATFFQEMERPPSR